MISHLALRRGARRGSGRGRPRARVTMQPSRSANVLLHLARLGELGVDERRSAPQTPPRRPRRRRPGARRRRRQRRRVVALGDGSSALLPPRALEASVPRLRERAHDARRCARRRRRLGAGRQRAAAAVASRARRPRRRHAFGRRAALVVAPRAQPLEMLAAIGAHRAKTHAAALSSALAGGRSDLLHRLRAVGAGAARRRVRGGGAARAPPARCATADHEPEAVVLRRRTPATLPWRADERLLRRLPSLRGTTSVSRNSAKTSPHATCRR